MKYFTLAAAPLLASALDLERVGNTTTWEANEFSGDPAGAHITFSIPEGFNFQNGTGVCTVNGGDDGFTSLNVGGFQVVAAASANEVSYANFRDSAVTDFSVMVSGSEANTLSMSCDDSIEMPEGSLLMGTFPFHNEQPGTRQGSVSCRGRLWPETFVMSWPDAANVTLHSEHDVSVERQSETDFLFTSNGYSADDLWFSYDCDSLVGSYEITVVGV